MASDYENAALRHYADAEHLAKSGRYDNAGHLIGFAAECALKKAARPFFRSDQCEIDGHLPNELKGKVRRELQGRAATGRLLGLVHPNSSFFSDWHINDRYSADGHVKAESYGKWLQQTRDIFSIARVRLQP
jgi:hypothetical protein